MGGGKEGEGCWEGKEGWGGGGWVGEGLGKGSRGVMKKGGMEGGDWKWERKGKGELGEEKRRGAFLQIKFYDCSLVPGAAAASR